MSHIFLCENPQGKGSKMPNRLTHEYSPYLQQHATNPVEWYPWGEEAFQKAATEDKPIFLSIGYSTCHWCHVMAHESFENPQVANILNTHFINIKVDKEERPDIDKHYQEVFKKMNNRVGGWPTSIFMTSDLQPFYTASYLPSEPKYGKPSFTYILQTIIEKYTTNKTRLIEEGDDVLHSLNQTPTSIQATKLDKSIISRAIQHATQLFDTKEGGFGQAPKFPQTSIIKLLLTLYQLTHNQEVLTMVTFTLRSMARGGLRDLVEGGFCRYATDTAWLIPHFEKMTYDNALLAEVYLDTYAQTKEHFYKEIAFETLEFMLENMSQDDLFYSASDADLEGREGAYFIFSYQEVHTLLKEANIPESAIDEVCKALHITEAGNFEGYTIMRVEDPSKTETIPYYQEAIAALKVFRKQRTYPHIDQKIITSWNAMVIKTLFKAARFEPAYLTIAEKSLQKLLDTLYPNHQLFHVTLLGKPPKTTAFLEDYAYLAETLIEAYQTTLNETYLITATRLTNTAIERYYKRGEWLFSTGEFQTKTEIYDTSYPSALSTMVSVLHSLSSLVDNVYKKFVFKTLERHSYDVMRQPISSPKLTTMLIRYLTDDFIIKSDEANLLPHVTKQDTLLHPFVLFKSDATQHFMLCNSSACFSEKRSFDEIEVYLTEQN